MSDTELIDIWTGRIASDLPGDWKLQHENCDEDDEVQVTLASEKFWIE